VVLYCSVCNCVCVVIIDLISFSAPWYIIMDPLEQFGIHYTAEMTSFLPNCRLDDGMNEFRCIRFLISNLSIIKHCWIYYGKSLLFSFHIRRLYDPTNSLINQHTIRLAVYTYTYKGCIIIISEQRRCM
jgi:hypothetical protein